MSKELEHLKELEMWATNGYTACEVEKSKELVKPIEKSLKALEIIKENFDIISMIKKASAQGLIDLPDEQYELLKEVLK